MKVAITGANGFLGLHLVQSALNHDFEVIALVRASAHLDSLAKETNLTVIQIDYLSADTVTKSLDLLDSKIDFFIHNAGLTVSARKSDYYHVNTTLTGYLIEGIRKSRCLKATGKFVLISSYASNGPYGKNFPVSHYGRSKKAAEELVQQSTIRNLIVRPTGVYGSGDKAFLPLFKLAKKRGYPVLTSRSQKLSLIHVKDLSEAIITNMRKSEGVLHMSDGNTYLHKDLKDAFQKLFERKIYILKIPSLIIKLFLFLATPIFLITKNRPNITLEKFNELSRDWNLKDDPSLVHSDFLVKYDLESGFKEALEYYKNNQLI